MKTLRKSIGSREEKVLKNIFHDLSNQDNVKSYVNLVIEVCNAVTPVPFSQSCIVLENFNKEIYKSQDYAETFDHITMCFEQLFKTEIIKKAALDGIASVPEELAPAFHVLLQYLHDVEKHQIAISTVKKHATSKTVWNAVLAQHLFSQLIPGHQYLVDNRQSEQLKECPCPCETPIVYGSTVLGSSATWHGFVDMVLNQSVAVTLLEDTDEIDKELDEPPVKKMCKPDDDDDSKEKKLIELPSKNRCYDNQIDLNLCVEVKTEVENRQILNNIKIQSQLLAESITNAFVQVSRSKKLSGWLIPTFGCTSEHVLPFLYDPKNDILLEGLEILPLWEDNGTLCLSSIVEIWMLLNFTMFTKPNLAEEYDLKKSGFHTFAKKLLPIYQDLEIKPLILGCETECYIDKTMQKIRRFGKAVRKKTEKSSLL